MSSFHPQAGSANRLSNVLQKRVPVPGNAFSSMRCSIVFRTTRHLPSFLWGLSNFRLLPIKLINGSKHEKRDINCPGLCCFTTFIIFHDKLRSIFFNFLDEQQRSARGWALSLRRAEIRHDLTYFMRVSIQINFFTDPAFALRLFVAWLSRHFF